MSIATENPERYTTAFTAAQAGRVDREPTWLVQIRKKAMESFLKLGFPTTRDEEWRYTNVEPIMRTEFVSAGRDGGGLTVRRLTPFLYANTLRNRLVFVNGYYADGLSSLTHVPQGVTLTNLAKLLGAQPERAQACLSRYTRYQEHPFVALNTAFFEDGAYLHIAKGVVVDEPIHLLFVTTAVAAPSVSHARVLIVCDAGSQVTIVESYVGLGSGRYFTNQVTELVARDNAVVDHYRIQRESTEAYHVATMQIHQSRDSNVASQNITFGGGLVRNAVNVALAGEGCDCQLNGLYVLSGRQHVDNHLRVEHLRPHGTSREFYKGVLDGQSRGVFTGRIFVERDAQKTDAKQTNMNLILSDGALVDTKPQLEIFADDVKCTHGATIGQVDGDAIFYLRSRGISASSARSLLVYAFANEIIERVKIAGVRAQLRQLVAERLLAGELIQETP